MFSLASRVLTETLNGTTASYGYDATSQLTSTGTATYSYDPTGNRTLSVRVR